MMLPQEMAESVGADQRLLEFMDNRELTIDRWLRTEFLADDFLAFASEFTEVSEAKRREILELGGSRLGTSLTYDHRVDQWLTTMRDSRRCTSAIRNGRPSSNRSIGRTMG